MNIDNIITRNKVSTVYSDAAASARDFGILTDEARRVIMVAAKASVAAGKVYLLENAVTAAATAAGMDDDDTAELIEATC